MNIFNGILALQSATNVLDEPTKWDIVASFFDNSGFFYASDTLVGDIVYVDGTSLNLGLLRYRITEINVLTDYSTLYARIEWALPSLENLYEPLCGFETVLGRQLLGGVFLPSPTVQSVSDNFIAYARNLESWLISRFSYSNRVYNAAYTGEKDGVNVTFTTIESFIAETLSVKVNGIELQRNEDYTLNGNSISLVLPPANDEIVVFDFNKN